MSHYQVIIQGGGMVGASLACALAQQGLEILLLEAKPPPPLDGGTDLRVSALSRASQHIFQHLGAWAEIATRGLSPYRDMRVWDAGNRSEIHFASAMVGEPCLGWIIENRLIQQALLNRLARHPGVSLRCPASLESLRVDPQQVSLRLDNGDRVTGQLLVGADGANSRVRELVGLTTQGWSYGQRALVTHVETETPHQETAWQRFLATGPLAFLPLADGRCSIVWSTLPDHAEALLAMNDSALGEALGSALEFRLGRVQVAGPRGAFPLALRHARRYVAPRVALIGDAAHVIHPLAGQGVNLGLLDAASLAEVLATHGDPGSQVLLRRYERWRKGHNLLMLGAMDGFKRLFGQTAAPLRALRGLGLNLTHRALPLKQLIIRQAMGLEGDLPALARELPGP